MIAAAIGSDLGECSGVGAVVSGSGVACRRSRRLRCARRPSHGTEARPGDREPLAAPSLPLAGIRGGGAPKADVAEADAAERAVAAGAAQSVLLREAAEEREAARQADEDLGAVSGGLPGAL